MPTWSRTLIAVVDILGDEAIGLERLVGLRDEAIGIFRAEKLFQLSQRSLRIFQRALGPAHQSVEALAGVAEILGEDVRVFDDRRHLFRVDRVKDVLHRLDGAIDLAGEPGKFLRQAN